MAQHHQDLYWLIRWTGMRVAEAAGIHLTDIDLNKQLIYVRPHPDRPLKNKYSERELPIHLKLLPVLEKLVTAGVRPFLMYYKPQRNRWEAGNNWRKVVNANPHLLRHHASTCMRNAGFQEYVIGKTLGHEVKGMTAQYGTVSPEKIKAAVYSIV
jgi:integrase